MKKETLYLIEYGFYDFSNKENAFGYKFGYTANWPSKRSYYRREMLDFQVMGLRDGGLELEDAFKTWYSEYFLKTRQLDGSPEWFVGDQRVVNAFKNLSETGLLSFVKYLYYPRRKSLLYLFIVNQLLQDPSNEDQQYQVWKYISYHYDECSEVIKKSDITIDMIKDFYDFAKNFLKVDLKDFKDISKSFQDLLDTSTETTSDLEITPGLSDMAKGS